MLDLVLHGGTVVDGTGRASSRADVGIRDGRIAVVGPIDEPATRTIDVSGLMVAPGFVDLHTHYDAQLSWDPWATPSPLHGVTTAIGGNCGFGLAPTGPADADYLMKLMARVEGMPLAALEQGLSWDWTSFGDWLGRFEGRLGINAGFLAGHSTLRRAVMGEDAVGGRASPGQIKEMVDLLATSLATGALGLSTSRSPTHHDGAGQPVPSRAASDEELLALCGAVAQQPGTTLELIFAGCLSTFSEGEVDLMTAMSLAANRPVNWNVLGVSASNPEGHVSRLDSAVTAARQGARIVALTLPHSMSVRLSFLSGFVLDGFPGWQPVMSLPPGERIAALRDRSVRARLAAGAASEEAGVLRALSNWGTLWLDETFAPENAAYEGRSVGEVATELGRDPFDVLLDIVVADDLRTGIRPPRRGDPAADWQLRTDVWRDPRVIVGGSDAGAHLDMMCGAVYTTALLAGVRTHGGLTIEEAVRLLTDVPARFYGLRGRGQIAPGWCADLVAFDPDRVDHGPERTVADLPGGASRLYADAVGIEHVLVNGTQIATGGRLTGSLPGTLLRSGSDTESVTVHG